MGAKRLRKSKSFAIFNKLKKSYCVIEIGNDNNIKKRIEGAADRIKWIFNLALVPKVNLLRSKGRKKMLRMKTIV